MKSKRELEGRDKIPKRPWDVELEISNLKEWAVFPQEENNYEDHARLNNQQKQQHPTLNWCGFLRATQSPVWVGTLVDEALNRELQA